VVVRVQLAHVLMCQHVPVVLRVDGNARPLGSSAGPPFGDRVADLPEIGGDLLFLPFALVVIPLVAAADLHAGVPAALVRLELVIGNGRVALAVLLLLCASRRAGLCCHGNLPSAPSSQKVGRRGISAALAAL